MPVCVFQQSHAMPDLEHRPRARMSRGLNEIPDSHRFHRCAPVPSDDSVATRIIGRYALPARQVSHGMFQSPRPSVPDRVPPTVFFTITMSPRLVLS